MGEVRARWLAGGSEGHQLSRVPLLRPAPWLGLEVDETYFRLVVVAGVAVLCAYIPPGSGDTGHAQCRVRAVDSPGVG